MGISKGIVELCSECPLSCSHLQSFVSNDSFRGMISEAVSIQLGHYMCQQMLNNTSEILSAVAAINNTSLNRSGRHSQTPSAVQVWSTGLLLVSVINACAFMGIIFLPLMKRRLYKLLLTYMVALAVGSLAGSALLVLIPDALDIRALTGSQFYLWKCTTILVGVYGFFLLERLLKVLIEHRTCSGNKNGAAADFALCPSMNIHREMSDSIGISDEMRMPPTWRPRLCSSNEEQECVEVVEEEEDEENSNDEKRSHKYEKESFFLEDQDVTESLNPLGGAAHGHNCNFFDKPVRSHSSGDQWENEKNGTGVLSKKSRSHEQVKFKKPVAPVAWMIILGDGVHNFVDGLSLGAAFSKSIMMGISLSVAVICEELPHELGDFAVLLNSGMSMKKALLANFVSACTCYLGFAVGALMAELNDNSSWILALAGGMFLYISLVDMMPEVIRMYEMDEAAALGRWKVFLLQNLGLISGYCCIFLITLYGDLLEFEQT